MEKEKVMPKVKPRVKQRVKQMGSLMEIPKGSQKEKLMVKQKEKLTD